MIIAPVLFFGCVLWSALAIESSPLLVRYDLAENHCLNGTIPNVADETRVPALKSDLLSGRCLPSFGVEMVNSRVPDGFANAAFLSEAGAMVHVVDNRDASSTGLSLELWFKPTEHANTSTQVLFASGLPPDPLPDISVAISHAFDVDVCKDLGVDLLVAYRQGEVIVFFKANHGLIFEPCEVIRTIGSGIAVNEMNHVVVSLGVGRQSIIVNGVLAASAGADFDSSLDQWNAEASSSMLQYPGFDTFSGKFYRVSIYGDPLTEFQALDLISVGLLPSEPFAIDQTVEIYEDAEYEPGSHPNDWYERPAQYDHDATAKIPLSYASVGADVSVLQERAGLETHDIFNITRYITKFPERGSLYFADGRAIALDTTDAFLMVHEDAVAFIPEHDEYSGVSDSPYATFEFCVSSVPIVSAIQCRVATVFIKVLPVNDPPVAQASPAVACVEEGDYPEKSDVIRLFGTDVDHDDTVSLIQITNPPRFGYLVLSVASFRDDGLIHGTPLQDIGYVMDGPAALVEYRYQYDANTILQANHLTDSFSFRVADASGSWSDPKEAVVRIHSAVDVSMNAESMQVWEDTPTTIPLFALDRSGFDRPLGFFFERIPLESEGVLFTPLAEPVQEGQFLTELHLGFPYKESMNLTFVPSEDYCTHNSNPPILTYRAVALVDEKVVSVSDTVSLSMPVTCVPDKLAFTGPTGVFHLEAIDDLKDNPCSGYVFNASSGDSRECSDAAIITDLELSGGEGAIGRAVVNISTKYGGYVTLNRKFWNESITLDGHVEMQQQMTLLVVPDRISDVLSFLHYSNPKSGIDFINLEILYGDCGVDLPKHYAAMSGAQDSPHCQRLLQTIPLVVEAYQKPKPEILFGTFPWMPLPFSIALLVYIKLRGKCRRVVNELEPETEKPSTMAAMLAWIRRTGTADTEDSLSECSEESSTAAERPEQVDDVQSTTQQEVEEADPVTDEDCQWIQHYDPVRGLPYYQRAGTDFVTWEPPLHLLEQSQGDGLSSETTNNTDR